MQPILYSCNSSLHTVHNSGKGQQLLYGAWSDCPDIICLIISRLAWTLNNNMEQQKGHTSSPFLLLLSWSLRVLQEKKKLCFRFLLFWSTVTRRPSSFFFLLIYRASSIESLMEGQNRCLNQFDEIPRRSIFVCYLSLSAKAVLNLPPFEIICSKPPSKKEEVENPSFF